MPSSTSAPVIVNGRTYAWPSAPVVGVCIDGSEPETDAGAGYIEAAIKAGVAPTFARFIATGTYRLAKSAIPSFTNPNNLSIVTGAPPAVHGICGNYFFDPDAGEEVMMNDPALLRAETIFKAFQEAGANVAVITAKDKLRRLLGAGLKTGGDAGAVCFSAEKADETAEAEHGISGVLDLVGRPVPEVYSTDLSEFVFAAGVTLMERDRPDLMYLSTTDYLQHKAAPGSDEANAFYAMMDGYLAQLDAMGCVIAITADHGMNAKHGADGAPEVIYLADLLEDWGVKGARIILPITDPYVGHHGALGSYATVYLADGTEAGPLDERLRATPGIAAVLDRAAATARFELPPDRVGDLIVLSERHVTLGTTPRNHDLSRLNGPLRSHGGLTEQIVPFLVNRRVDLDEGRALRNFDLFGVALNGAQ